MIELDVPFLFETVGGPRALLTLLDQHVPDHGLAYPTVQMWQQRSSVPGRFLPAVLYALYRAGHDDSLLAFFTDRYELSAAGDL